MAFASINQASVGGGSSNALSIQSDGIFMPRLSTGQRTALALTTSDAGLTVYDFTLNNLFIWNGAAWESIPGSGDAGANGSVQYNDNGIVSGATNFTYNKATSAVSVAGDLTVRTTGLIVNATGVGMGMTPTDNLNVGSTLYASVSTKIDSITQTSHIFKGTPDAVGYEYAKIVSGRESSPSTYGSFLAFYTEGKNSGTTDTSVERARFNSTGNLAFVTGKGIDFSAVTGGTGTATANVLNDYEEGTWTPTISAETNTIGATVVNSANYTKIGRLVSVTFDITITSAGTGTGGLKLSLPFTSAVAGPTCGALREYQVTGNMGQVYRFDATNMLCNSYNNSTLIVANYQIMGGYTYFV